MVLKKKLLTFVVHYTITEMISFQIFEKVYGLTNKKFIEQSVNPIKLSPKTEIQA